MNRPLRFAIIVAALAMLAGCGNKGPLVMPQKPVPVDVATEPATPADVTTPTEPATDDTTPAEATPTPAEPEPTATPPADDDGNG